AHPERFVRYARKVWGIEGADCDQVALEGIAATVAYFKSLGMPTCLSELGIGVQPEAVLEAMANQATRGGAIRLGSFCPLDQEGALAVYRLANR
ncbi:MAG: iron-containing alcohol dehydrogenase, partial [Christensenellaceae bacterium]